jgi:hypothetical protein
MAIFPLKTGFFGSKNDRFSRGKNRRSGRVYESHRGRESFLIPALPRLLQASSFTSRWRS